MCLSFQLSLTLCSFFQFDYVKVRIDKKNIRFKHALIFSGLILFRSFQKRLTRLDKQHAVIYLLLYWQCLPRFIRESYIWRFWVFLPIHCADFHVNAWLDINLKNTSCISKNIKYFCNRYGKSVNIGLSGLSYGNPLKARLVHEGLSATMC